MSWENELSRRQLEHHTCADASCSGVFLFYLLLIKSQPSKNMICAIWFGKKQTVWWETWGEKVFKVWNNWKRRFKKKPVKSDEFGHSCCSWLLLLLFFCYFIPLPPLSFCLWRPSFVIPPPFPHSGLAHPPLWPHYSLLNRSQPVSPLFSPSLAPLCHPDFFLLIHHPLLTTIISLPVLTTHFQPLLSPSIWSFPPRPSVLASSLIPMHPKQSHPFLSLSPCSFLSPSFFSPVRETDGKEVCNETAVSSTLPKLTRNEWSHWSARCKAVQKKKQERGGKMRLPQCRTHFIDTAIRQHEYTVVKNKAICVLTWQLPLYYQVSCISNSRWVQKICFFFMFWAWNR